jgi:RNA polymerase sigma factor (sigma-70 family)
MEIGKPVGYPLFLAVIKILTSLMTWFSRLFRGKSKPPREYKDSTSEYLRTADLNSENAEAWWGLLYEKLKRIFEGGGVDDAHDLAILVVIKVLRENKYMGASEMFAEAMRIAPGIAANAQRKLWRDRNRELQGLKVEGVQPAKQLHSMIEQERDKLQRDCLNEALSKLPPSERELFVRYHNCLNAGFSSIECAELLGKKRQTLKNKTAMIKLRLSAYVKKCMKKFGY